MDNKCSVCHADDFLIRYLLKIDNFKYSESSKEKRDLDKAGVSLLGANNKYCLLRIKANGH